MKYKVNTGLARDPFRLKEKIDLAISYGYIEEIKEEKVKVVKPKKKRTVKNKK